MAEQSKTLVYPVIPIRDLVIFPGIVSPLFISRPKSIRAVEEAADRDRTLFIVSEKRPYSDTLQPEGLYKVGTVCKMLQNVRLPDGTLKVVVEGGRRAEVKKMASNDSFMLASVVILDSERPAVSTELRALMRAVLRGFEENVRLDPKLPEEIARSVRDIDDPEVLCDIIASHGNFDITDKQKILETVDAEDRLNLLMKMLVNENELLGFERDLEEKVRSEIDRDQHNYYLREQLKVINDELGEESPTSEADALLSKNSGFLQASKYPNFYILKPGHWQDVSELLQTPHFYIQDPSTFHAPELLDPAPGEKCLDLCAAPGGKSRAIADIIKGKISDNPNAYAPDVRSETLIVSVDFGERRMKTLRENMGKLKFPKSVCLDCDLCGDSLPEVLSEYELPEFYDAVLLDAPCSNTGVLRRRPDAKYRLSPIDLDKCAKIQAKILRVAAEHLKPGGRLVYSTCSIEPCENIEIVEEFLNTHSSFRLAGCKKIFPSEQSDGASAFLLKKNA